MISSYNKLGKITLTQDYFTALVGNAITSCYGVAGMDSSNTYDGVRSLLFGENVPEKGVIVKTEDSQLIIDLHIKVIFGVNISAIVENITQKVSYVVQDSTGLEVKKVNVVVSDIVSQ